jgi:hypothetical protein
LCARSHSWGLKYWGNITRQPGEDILTPQAPTAARRPQCHSHARLLVLCGESRMQYTSIAGRRLIGMLHIT